MIPRCPQRSGFTLVELLVVIAIVALLAGLLLSAIRQVQQAANGAKCLASLSQLGSAMALYQADHQQAFVRYRENTSAGVVWYFGLESAPGGGEGSRVLDQTHGPLYPYTRSVGGIVVCPAFDYHTALWKPKFKGASWGYGYNVTLGGGALGTAAVFRTTDLAHPAQVVVFGDCAQVNTFQAPASAGHPMVEEFYLIDAVSSTIHFRHEGALANFLFADGHIKALPMSPGTKDMRLPDANIGRIAPAGSLNYLR